MTIPSASAPRVERRCSMSCADSRDQATESKIARATDQAAGVERRDVRKGQNVGAPRDCRFDRAFEVIRADAVRGALADDPHPQRCRDARGVLALPKPLGGSGSDKRDGLHALPADQMAIDRRDRLVTGHLAEHGVAAGRPVERAREGVGKHHSPIALDDRQDSRHRLLDIWADYVANAFLFGQVASAFSGARSAENVVEAPELDFESLSSDVDASSVVVHLGGDLGAMPVDRAPRRGRPAHHAEHTDPKRPVRCCGPTDQRAAHGLPPIDARALRQTLEVEQ